jgi:hypothetical protein
MSQVSPGGFSRLFASAQSRHAADALVVGVEPEAGVIFVVGDDLELMSESDALRYYRLVQETQTGLETMDIVYDSAYVQRGAENFGQDSGDASEVVKSSRSHRHIALHVHADHLR